MKKAETKNMYVEEIRIIGKAGDAHDGTDMQRAQWKQRNCRTGP